MDPALQISEFDYEALAVSEGITVEAARARYRHLELTAEDGTGIQLTLFDDTAAIQVPYSHTGRATKAVMAKVWNYLKLLKREAGYVAYDPQMGNVLDIASDYPKVVHGYASAGKRPQQKRGGGKGRLWWKFW